jgi:hypothetical protein
VAPEREFGSDKVERILSEAEEPGISFVVPVLSAEGDALATDERKGPGLFARSKRKI